MVRSDIGQRLRQLSLPAIAVIALLAAVALRLPTETKRAGKAFRLALGIVRCASLPGGGSQTFLLLSNT